MRPFRHPISPAQRVSGPTRPTVERALDHPNGPRAAVVAAPDERVRPALRAGQQVQRFIASLALRFVEVGRPLAALAEDRGDRMAGGGHARVVALGVGSPIDLDLDDPPRPLAPEPGGRSLHGSTDS